MDEIKQTFKIGGELWLYPGKAGWHFLTVSASTSKKIRNFIGNKSSAWGSVRVSVTIADYSWDTSIFPDSASKTYQLPVKKEARAKLGLKTGDRVSGTLLVKRLDDEDGF